MTKYNTYTLKNGLRIIHLPSPSQVVYCGYQIAAGTRNESSGEEGIAHFCEHMTFKGTERRNAIQIINALEGVGGELNAFTNKEDTVFYAAISKEHFSQAVDILTDIVFHSQYPQHEIEKEVEVICDEIESYNDSPAELIYDDFENIIFEGHPLGHNILGNAEQLRTYTTEDALRFVRRNYRTNNAIFFAYGDVDFSKICKSVECRTDSVECRVENVEFATAAEISCGAVARSSSAGLLPEGRKNSKLSTLNSQLPSVLYGDTDIVDSNGNFLHHRRLAPPENLTWKSFRNGMLVCHQAFYARTDFAIATPYNQEYRYSADVDWCIRIMKAAAKENVPMLNLHMVVANYTQEGQTTLHHRESLKERYRVMECHYGRVQTFFMHCWFIIRAVLKS